MAVVEGWGTGIPKMYEDAEAYGLKEPEIIDQGNSFRVNLFRANAEKTTEKAGVSTEKATEKAGVSTEKTTEKILRIITERPGVTAGQIAEELGMTIDGVDYNIRKLKQQKAIIRIGGDKGGKWVVVLCKRKGVRAGSQVKSEE